MAEELTWKYLYESASELRDRLEKENEELRHRIAFLESTTNQGKPKKAKMKNTIGLKVLDGGQNRPNDNI